MIGPDSLSQSSKSYHIIEVGLRSLDPGSWSSGFCPPRQVGPACAERSLAYGLPPCSVFFHGPGSTDKGRGGENTGRRSLLVHSLSPIQIVAKLESIASKALVYEVNLSFHGSVQDCLVVSRWRHIRQVGRGGASLR